MSTTTNQPPSTASAAATIGISLAEQVASMAAPEALQLIAGELDKVKATIAGAVGGFEAKHPVAAQAITTANSLLAKLFPSESGLITDLESLDL